LILGLALAVTIPFTGSAYLAPGIVEVSTEIRIPDGAHDLKVFGGKTVLRAAGNFRGRAILTCRGCRNIEFHDLTIDGNRPALERPMPLPPSGKPFAAFYPNNGILLENARGALIDGVKFSNIANYAILIAHSSDVFISRVTVENSGSHNEKGRNNASGGILLEEGSSNFSVTGSTFRHILGNAVWTHSIYGSPRNATGRIANNTFEEIGRDAIQVGHATAVTVVNNTAKRIGFPAAIVDVESQAWSAVIDTAGDVDRSTYENNRMEEVNGKCIDLDGFHDGAVRGNTCTNRGKPEEYPYGHFGIVFNNANPDMHSRNIQVTGNHLDGMKYGAVFAIGAGHHITGNTFTRLNTAHCPEAGGSVCNWRREEPDILRSGIYIADRAERADPAVGIAIENNTISGWGMAKHCVGTAPGVKLGANTVRKNSCLNQ
jgi:Right handed beta helix region